MLILATILAIVLGGGLTALLSKNFRTYVRAGLKETARWTFYQVFLSLMPVWGGALILKLFRRPITIADFTSQGEFALYAASLSAGALHLISRERGSTGFPWKDRLLVSSFFMLILSSIVFAAVTSAGKALSNQPLDQGFLRDFTLATFLLSLTVSLTVVAIDSTPTAEDVSEQNSVQRRRLDEDFDNTEEA